MPKYTTELFENCPDSFLRFDQLAANAPTYLNFIKGKNMLEGVRSVLSIGAGQGELEIRLMQDHDIPVAYVDPTPNYVEAYRKVISTFESSHLAIETFEGRFEDYTPSRKFDLVIALHSWYAIGFNEQALSKAINCKNDGGRLLIALASRESFHIEIANALNGDNKYYVTAEKLADWINGLGFACELSPVIRKITAGGLRSNGQITPDGKALIEFLGRSPMEDFSTQSLGQCFRILDKYTENDELQFISKSLTIS